MSRKILTRETKTLELIVCKAIELNGVSGVGTSPQSWPQLEPWCL